jgi:hypothetical protein
VYECQHKVCALRTRSCHLLLKQLGVEAAQAAKQITSSFGGLFTRRQQFT